MNYTRIGAIFYGLPPAFSTGSRGDPRAGPRPFPWAMTRAMIYHSILIPFMAEKTPMMELTVNGETHRVPEETTAQMLLERLELAGRRLAMEVNGELVPRSTFPEHRFAPGDRVEIVQAIGGG
ncbi:thiamine biosynthesis protein ThiS [Ectothiorhodospira mobilis]|nr:thiamine biosynthesis protein ThiS [Ectothiorhodospira mobilis]